MKLAPQLVFAASLCAGLLRAALFGPATLPYAVMAPFESMRGRLVSLSGFLFGSEAPLLSAMLWGYKANIPDGLYEAYRMSGIAHVLALSGLHVSFVAAVVDKVTLKSSRKAKLYIASAVLLAYCAIAAFPASLIRASVMTVCTLYAGASGRRYDIASGVSFAALLILLFDPSELFEVGFQLSFGAVAAIALLMPPLRRALKRLPETIGDSIAVSVCGSLGTLPLSAHYFKTVPLLGLLANALILPVVSLAFVSALLVSLLGLLFPAAASVAAAAPVLLARAMTAAASYVASASFAVATARGVSMPLALLPFLAYFAASDYLLLRPPYKYAIAAALIVGAAAAVL